MSQLFKHLRQVVAMTHDENESRAIAFLLLEDVCGLSRTDVVMDRDDLLSDEQKNMLESMAKRIADGAPLQYVTGKAWFDGLLLDVAPGVLIPRPETAELVDHVCGYLNGNAPTSTSGRPLILDIGTGSGCIALSVKSRVPQSEVHAIDISYEALLQAAANAQKHNLDVCFHKCDILDKSQIRSLFGTKEGQFQAIVSNPPYICDSERVEMSPVVLDYEPPLALFVHDDDALVFYRAIADMASLLLCEGGMLAFEINRRFGREVCDLLSSGGYTDVRLIKDQFGNDRIVTAIR